MRHSLGRLLPTLVLTLAAAIVGATLALIPFVPAAAQSADSASKTLTFAMTRTSVGPRVAGTILAEAYAKLGYRVAFVDVPQIRSAALANENKLDGEVSRVASIVETYPNLVRVDPPVYRVSPHFFSGRSDIDASDRSNLHSRTVGIVRGIQSSLRLVGDLNPIVIDDPITLFRMLDAGRVDIGVVPYEGGRFYAALARSQHVRPVGDPLSTEELFHFLSAENARLAPDISRVLLNMVESGEIEALTRRALATFYDEARGAR